MRIAAGAHGALLKLTKRPGSVFQGACCSTSTIHHPLSTIHLFLQRALVSFPVASLPSPFITSAPVLTEDRARAGGREPGSRPPRNTQISRARALTRRPKSEREREIAGGNPSSSVSAVSPSNARSRFQRSFRHLCLLLCALSMVAMGGSAEVRRRKKAGRPRRLCADVASQCLLPVFPPLPSLHSPQKRDIQRHSPTASYLLSPSLANIWPWS